MKGKFNFLRWTIESIDMIKILGYLQLFLNILMLIFYLIIRMKRLIYEFWINKVKTYKD